MRVEKALSILNELLYKDKLAFKVRLIYDIRCSYFILDSVEPNSCAMEPCK